MTSDHLVIDARADYVLCVNDGLLAASLPSWRDFLAGYLTREKEKNKADGVVAPGRLNLNTARWSP